MSDAVAEALARWGVPYLFPYQELVIRGLLDRDRVRQAVILPTGAGKSLCFQLPAELLPHPTLVVYPLRSLTADQKRRSDRAGLDTVVLQGGQTRAQRDEVWRRLASGEVKLLLSNPETLAQPRVLERLAQVSLSHAVIDEAHCVELWGTSFRPGYRELARILAALGVPRITAFTATAGQDTVAGWATSIFGGEPFDLIRASADRPNLHFAQEPYLSMRLSLPRAVIREQRPALVFCRNREGVRKWAHHLYRTTAIDVRFYHAGLSRDEKTAVERWFFDSGDGVLCATNAYGMGVDKANIRTVFHLDAAPGPEDYLQEAGRAGRDGAPARAIRFVPLVPEDEEQACRRAELLRAFDEEAACSGCDVCDGTAGRWPSELGSALGRLAPWVHRLDAQDCRRFLAGRVVPDLWDSDLPLHPGWGLWADEDDLTVRELWGALEGRGWVEFARRGLWKGLLKPLNRC